MPPSAQKLISFQQSACQLAPTEKLSAQKNCSPVKPFPAILDRQLVAQQQPPGRERNDRPMSKRQKEWARRARRRILDTLGNRCANCGETENLELDCIRPKGDTHHGFSFDQRTSFYRKQMRNGNIQILCAECNALKSHKSQTAWLLLNNKVRQLFKRDHHIMPCEHREQLRKLCSPREYGGKPEVDNVTTACEQLPY